MSRYAKPRFLTPKVPATPKAIGRLSTLVAAAQGILTLAAKIPSFNLGNFILNSQLAQQKVNQATQKQNQVKAKLKAKAAKLVVPDGVQADLAEVARYQAELAELRDGISGAVDEFGDAVA